jgi:hypothetical protein
VKKSLKISFYFFTIAFCVFTYIRQNVSSQQIISNEKKYDQLDSSVTAWIHELKIEIIKTDKRIEESNRKTNRAFIKANKRIDRQDSILTKWLGESKLRRLASDSILKGWIKRQAHRDTVWNKYEAQLKSEGEK